MKKGLILFIIASVMAIGSSFGQGIFSPLSQRIRHSIQVDNLTKGALKASTTDSTSFVWGLAVSTNAQGYSISKNPVSASFNFFGAGLSDTKYRLVKGQPEAIWNVSVQAISSYTKDQTAVPGFGLLIAAGISPAYLLNIPNLPVFLTAGVSYLGAQGVNNGTFWLNYGINISF